MAMDSDLRLMLKLSDVLSAWDDMVSHFPLVPNSQGYTRNPDISVNNAAMIPGRYPISAQVLFLKLRALADFVAEDD